MGWVDQLLPLFQFDLSVHYYPPNCDTLPTMELNYDFESYVHDPNNNQTDYLFDEGVTVTLDPRPGHITVYIPPSSSTNDEELEITFSGVTFD